MAGSMLSLGVAAVWVHQGLWCKVLGRRADHEAIVADVPAVGEGLARTVTVGIGLAETGLAVWLLSGKAPRRAATVQTALLLGMNGGGMMFARDRIPDVPKMVVRNSGFLAAIWMAALRRSGG